MGELRKVLARNINALMESNPALDVPRKVLAASGVANGTLHRYRTAEAGANIDQVEMLAGAFEVEPWQMLYPDLDPKHPPVVQTTQGLPATRHSLQADDLATLFDEHCRELGLPDRHRDRVVLYARVAAALLQADGSILGNSDESAPGAAPSAEPVHTGQTQPDKAQLAPSTRRRR